MWRGNKKEIGALKSLITEPKQFIEGKGKDGYWIENYKHLIACSNEDWANSLKEGCWDHANVGPSSELQNITIHRFYDHYKA